MALNGWEKIGVSIIMNHHPKEEWEEDIDTMGELYLFPQVFDFVRGRNLNGPEFKGKAFNNELKSFIHTLLAAEKTKLIAEIEKINFYDIGSTFKTKEFLDAAQLGFTRTILKVLKLLEK